MTSLRDKIAQAIMAKGWGLTGLQAFDIADSILAIPELPTCPHVYTGKDGTSHCTLAARESDTAIDAIIKGTKCDA